MRSNTFDEEVRSYLERIERGEQDAAVHGQIDEERLRDEFLARFEALQQRSPDLVLQEPDFWRERLGDVVRHVESDGRAHTGLFIATGGFTSAFHEARAAHKAQNVLVIPADADDLDRWITADDRLAVLRELHQRATFDMAR